jgi:hypothetical protein
MQSWNVPSTVIPAVSGLVGAAIGGLCTIWAATRQLNAQWKQEKRERREAVARQMEGAKVLIRNAKRPAQCTEAALRLRRFFVDNPQRLYAEPGHVEFFETYLAPLSEGTPPSDLYWTDLRMLGFLTDGDRLKP